MIGSKRKYLCPNCMQVCEGIYVGIKKLGKGFFHQWRCSKCKKTYMAGKPKSKQEAENE